MKRQESDFERFCKDNPINEVAEEWEKEFDRELLKPKKYEDIRLWKVTENQTEQISRIKYFISSTIKSSIEEERNRIERDIATIKRHVATIKLEDKYVILEDDIKNYFKGRNIINK